MVADRRSLERCRPTLAWGALNRGPEPLGRPCSIFLGRLALQIGKEIERTGSALEIVACHVCVDLGGAETLVSEQQLDLADMDPAFQQVGRKTVPERVHGNLLGDPCTDPTEASEPEVLTSVNADGVAEITLNRPDRMNAFTWRMGRLLDDALKRFDGDDDVRAIIVTGKGKAFCAGADLGRGGKTFDRGGRAGDARKPAKPDAGPVRAEERLHGFQ